MAGMREKELKAIIASLEKQGGRVEYGNGKESGGGGGGYPIKVWPPDKSKHFVLFHGTATDSASITLKRNDVRNAGFLWPFDDANETKIAEKIGAQEYFSRKEKNVATTTEQVGQVMSGKPLEHAKVPPGVAARKYPPSVSSLQALEPLLKLLPDTFWTDMAMDLTRSLRIPGYASGKDTSRMQGMLDFLGYRVVEFKPNRGGWSYRWVHDPNAVIPEASTAPQHAGRVTPITPTTAVETPAAEAPEPQPAPGSTIVAAGPIADAMAEAERKRREKVERAEREQREAEVAPAATGKGLSTEGHLALRSTKHERQQCPTCGRWFTPLGYEHHVEDTQHGIDTRQTTAKLRTKDLVVPLPQPEPQPVPNPEPSEPLQPEPVTVTAGDEPWVPTRADFDAMEQMAQEAEARAASLDRQLVEAAAMVERQQRETEVQVAAKNSALDQVAKLIAQRDALGAHGEQMQATIDLLQSRQPAVADDGSWLIDVAGLPQHVGVATVIANAAMVGVTIEMRGRRA